MGGAAVVDEENGGGYQDPLARPRPGPNSLGKRHHATPGVAGPGRGAGASGSASGGVGEAVTPTGDSKESNPVRKRATRAMRDRQRICEVCGVMLRATCLHHDMPERHKL